jgi:hypothetical protein
MIDVYRAFFPLLPFIVLNTVSVINISVCLFIDKRVFFPAIWRLPPFIAVTGFENLDLCLALYDFSSFFYVPRTAPLTRDLCFKVISERPVILTSEYRNSEGAINTSTF